MIDKKDCKWIKIRSPNEVGEYSQIQCLYCLSLALKPYLDFFNDSGRLVVLIALSFFVQLIFKRFCELVVAHKILEDNFDKC